jgi:hypothetical protein
MIRRIGKVRITRPGNPFLAGVPGHGQRCEHHPRSVDRVASVVWTVWQLCQLCHAPDGIALPQFLPQSACRDHQRQGINPQFNGCQRKPKHAAPVTGGQVVAGSIRLDGADPL